MKKIAILLVSFTTLIQAPAQLFSPESLHGAMWGGLIGGMVGSDPCHGLSEKNAAIGAGIGLFAGTLAGEARRNDYPAGQLYSYVPAPTVSFGYGYGSCGSSAYVYYAPNSYCAPGYYYPSTRPNYAVSGTVLGAASGALIGSANHNAGQGADIGAAAGLVLGGVAELGAQTTSAQLTPPQPGVTSTPGPTSTYTWTTRPQIADATRVPDAPTF